MKTAKTTHSPEEATRKVLLTQCKEASRNIQTFKQWVDANPWLDQAQLHLSMPWYPFICLAPESKPLVVTKLGEEEWKVVISGEIRKNIQGIIVAVAV